MVRQLLEQLSVQRQLLFPCCFIDAGHGVELLLRKRQAGPGQVLITWSHAHHVVGALACAFNAVNHPLQHAHVLAVAWPDKLAVVTFSKPVGGVDFRQDGTCFGQLFTHVQPVLEVVAHVVARERQHGERVTADHTGLAGGGGSCFAAHGGGHVHALYPVACFCHQRHGG